MPQTRFTREHEWLRLDDDGIAAVGITAHAQGQLGDIVFVELPEPGREVTAGEACAVVESVKAAADVYSPLAGRVVEGNPALADDPRAGEPRRPRRMAGSSGSSLPNRRPSRR